MLTTRIIDVSSFGGSDTSKLQQAIKKACLEPFATVYLPYTGTSYVIEDEIVASNLQGDFCAFNLIGDPCWHLIDFKAPAGTSCFRFINFKHGTIESIRIRTWKDEQVGFAWEGPLDSGSCGSCIVSNARVQFAEGVKSTGFLVGRGGNDYSAMLFQRCEVYGENGQFGSNTQAGYLKSVAQRNHRGFVFNGGNNLAQKIDSCAVVDCKIAVTQLSRELGQSGGAGLLVDNFGTTACNLIFQTDGGFPFYARGGRHELSGALISHGAPTGWQAATAVVRISDMILDSCRPNTGAQTGLFDPGAIISIRSASKCRFEGLVFGAGEPVNVSALTLAHNNSSLRAEVSFQDCQLPFDPLKPKILSGAWGVTVQNTRKIFGLTPST